MCSSMILGLLVGGGIHILVHRYNIYNCTASGRSQLLCITFIVNLVCYTIRLLNIDIILYHQTTKYRQNQ